MINAAIKMLLCVFTVIYRDTVLPCAVSVCDLSGGKAVLFEFD